MKIPGVGAVPKQAGSETLLTFVNLKIRYTSFGKSFVEHFTSYDFVRTTFSPHGVFFSLVVFGAGEMSALQLGDIFFLIHRTVPGTGFLCTAKKFVVQYSTDPDPP